MRPRASYAPEHGDAGAFAASTAFLNEEAAADIRLSVKARFRTATASGGREFLSFKVSGTGTLRSTIVRMGANRVAIRRAPQTRSQR